MVSQHTDLLQHDFAQHRMTKPSAMSGSPNCGQHPQQVEHDGPVHAAPNNAKLNRYDPYTKQIKSLSPNK